MTELTGVRCLAVLALCAALGLVACGGGDDDADAPQAAVETVETTTPDSTPAGDGAERQLRAVFEQMAAAIAAEDARAACEAFATAPRRQLAAGSGMRRGSQLERCVAGFEIAFSAGITEAPDPEFVRAELTGSDAVVYARVSNPDGGPAEMHEATFVKEADGWRVDTWLSD